MEKRVFSRLQRLNDSCTERRNSGVDAIVIFSGSAERRRSKKETISFSSTSFEENDTRGNLSLGKYRMIAGVQLSQEFPNARVVTLCWSVDKTGNRSPEYAESMIMGAELVRHGVRLENLTINNGDNPQALDTFTEMLEMLSMALDNRWSTVVVVGSHFQKKRALEMLHSLQRQNPKDVAQIQRVLDNYAERFPNLPSETVDYFRNIFCNLQQRQAEVQQIHAEFASAEAVMLRRSPARYGRLLSKIIATERYQQEERNGAKGAKDWREYTYGLPQNVVIH